MMYTNAQLIELCERAIERGQPQEDIDFYASIIEVLKPREQGQDALEEWACKVRKRQPYCAICGTRLHLQVHHIIPVNKHPELKYSIENGIVLCARHHLMVHGAEPGDPNSLWVKNDG